jgi:hypothetical protein
MRKLFVVVTALVVLSSAAYAQQPAERMPGTETGPAKFLVFFNLNDANLTPQGAEVIRQAADEYHKTGAAKVAVTGFTDTSGSAEYNLALSQRRAEAVQRELVKLGVPQSVITVTGKGQNDLLVPTADGVREARNRRVLIEIPIPPPPPPVPVAVAPQAGPPPPPPPPPPKKWSLSLGPWYGHNRDETNSGNNKKSSDLVGPELRLGYALSPTWSVYGDLVGFNTIDSSADDGWGGRAALGINHEWNLGAWHPFIGPKVGYIGGKGVQDGLVVGPELGVKLDLARNTFLYAQAAYDRDFRNSFGDGIINGGVGLGIRF